DAEVAAAIAQQRGVGTERDAAGEGQRLGATDANGAAIETDAADGERFGDGEGGEAAQFAAAGDGRASRGIAQRGGAGDVQRAGGDRGATGVSVRAAEGEDAAAGAVDGEVHLARAAAEHVLDDAGEGGVGGGVDRERGVGGRAAVAN